jgi:hypothetical protein
VNVLDRTAQAAADWGALATAFGAAVALIVGLAGLLQKARSDGRTEWWRRVQWSVDRATDERDEVAESGLIAMTHLMYSPLATDEGIRFIRDVAKSIAERET